MANRIKPTPVPTSTSGYYVKTEWQTGDVITRPRLMNIEDWLASANDELMLARTGYTANNRTDWTKYQFATIGERMDDMVDYIRKIVNLGDLSQIIKTIDAYVAKVKEESDTAVDNINDYDATVLQDANTASANIASYNSSVLTRANAAKTAIDNRTTEVNTKADQAISNINGNDSSVSQAASAALTSITNDRNSVSRAKTSAETTIAKYVDNETPATGETEGVKQVSEQAIDEIGDLVEQVKKSIVEGGIYPVVDNFTIPENSWTGDGPFTYEKTYSSINEEYNITVTLDKISYFKLNASLDAATNSNGKITFTTEKKPSGSIDVKIILQKVEAM